MTAQEQITLKTLLIHNQSAEASSLPAYRLLNDLGHEVAATHSVQQAVELLQHERADLVVIDSDEQGHSELVTRLTELPTDQQPRLVAIFSDSSDQRLSDLVDRLDRSNIQLLIKPLHMHGLLKVLRKIEGKA